MRVLSEVPSLLALTSAPPKKLYYQGDTRAFGHVCVAVVGTRRPSSYGVRTAYQMGRELARSGVCVVSGLARGIDGAAHAGALAGGGPTIAVLGHGLGRIYPVEHGRLAARIAENGLLLSEFEMGMPPLPQNFPRRNRIIAGISWLTVIIEAHERSGSLITAGFAADEGRDVLVVPGQLGDSHHKGSLNLIRDGARVFTSVPDLLDLLPGDRCGEDLICAEEFSELEAFFMEKSGVARLSEIRRRKELDASFRAALENGNIVEYRMHEYLWVGVTRRTVKVVLAKRSPPGPQ